MLIHIFPEVEGLLRQAVQMHIKESGHIEGDIAMSSVYIGLPNSHWYKALPPAIRGVLTKEETESDMQTDAVLFNALTCITVSEPHLQLHEWLRNIKDPLNV